MVGIGAILAGNGTLPGFLLHSLVPFTVTKPATIRGVSIAVESRDASLLFRKFLGEGLQCSVYVP